MTEEKSITLTLFMLAKNAAGCIVRTLESAYPYFIEFVLVDDSSSDGTPEIAKKWCDDHQIKFVSVKIDPSTHPQLYHHDALENYPAFAGVSCPGPFSGRDILVDFAGARNAGWDLCTSDWILVLDSDDVVMNPSDIPQDVCRAIASHADHLLGLYAVDEDQLPAVHLLFSRRGTGRWAGKIHERRIRNGIVVQGDINVRDMRDNPTANDMRVANRDLKVGWVAVQGREEFGDCHDLACFVQSLAFIRPATEDTRRALRAAFEILKEKAVASPLIKYVIKQIRTEEKTQQTLLLD